MEAEETQCTCTRVEGGKTSAVAADCRASESWRSMGGGWFEDDH